MLSEFASEVVAASIYVAFFYISEGWPERFSSGNVADFFILLHGGVRGSPQLNIEIAHFARRHSKLTFHSYPAIF